MDLVNSVIREIKRELSKDSSIAENVHSDLNEVRGRSLLSDLMDRQTPKTAAPIYH